MTDYPITPPSELLDEWCMDLTLINWRDIATMAAQWGADQELLACGNYLEKCAAWEPEDVTEFYNYRRPKPPSLKQQALATLEVEPDDAKELIVFDTEQVNIIRRALEQLND